MAIDEAAILSLIRSDENPPAGRVAALRALAAQESPRLDEMVRASLDASEVELRVAALALLARRDKPLALKRVREILSRPTDLREDQAAILTLGKIANAAADQVLLAQLERFSSDETAGVRLELLEAVGSRATQNSRLAEALKNLATPPDDDPASRFAECIEGGDAKRGRDLFLTHLQAQCVRCHRIGKQGSDVGPGLDGVATRRDARFLLRSMVAPSADIDEKYRVQTVVLYNGKVVQGVLLERGKEELVLADAQGKKIRIPREDVDQMVEQKSSIMPAMDRVLTPSELRDLVSFLRSLR